VLRMTVCRSSELIRRFSTEDWAFRSARSRRDTIAFDRRGDRCLNQQTAVTEWSS
jgi:hypothetical protein